MEVSTFSEGQRSFLERAGRSGGWGRLFGSRASARAGRIEAAVAWGGGRERTPKQGDNPPAFVCKWAPRQGKGFSDGPASAAAPAHDKQLSLSRYSSLPLFLGIGFII